MGRSLRVSPSHIKQVKKAIRLNGYASQKQFAVEVGFSISTIQSFLNGRAVDFGYFIEICGHLGLDWQETSSPETNTEQTELLKPQTHDSKIWIEREEKYRTQLQAKDREIDIYHRQSADMMEIAKMLANRTISIENKAMVGDNIRQEGAFGIGHMSGGEIKDSKVAGVINEAEEQNLAQAAEEIQQLLEQLENSYPTETTKGKMQLATEVITEIENNPSLKGKIVKALKAGSIAAMEKMLNHPAASFVAAVLRELK